MKAVQELISSGTKESFFAKIYTPADNCDSDRWHFHPEYEIVYVRNGSGICHVGNHRGEYQNGILLFIGPNLPHFPLSNSERADNIEVVIQFPEGFLKGLTENFPELKPLDKLIKQSESVISFGNVTRSALEPSLIDIAESPGPGRIISLLKVLHAMHEATDKSLLNSFSSPIEDHAFDRVKKVYDYISNNYQNHITLAPLAEEVGLTENSLCRYFKQHTGNTIFEFLTEFRISMARQRLKDTERISEVMYACGFNDPSHFNKQFKRIVGVSPSTFKAMRV